MTITMDTVDANITALREYRDGLRQTLMDEERQRAERTEELVNTAHKWADANGIGRSLEDLMEELGLPGRKPYREVQIEGGTATLHIHYPYSYAVAERLGSLRDFGIDNYQSTTLSQVYHVGTEMTMERGDEDVCVCDIERVVMNSISYLLIDAAVEKGAIITIEVGLSCGAPDCHHGYPEPVFAEPETPAEPTPAATEWPGVIRVTKETHPTLMAHASTNMDWAYFIADVDGEAHSLFVHDTRGAWRMYPMTGVPSELSEGKWGYWVNKAQAAEALATDEAALRPVTTTTEPQFCNQSAHPRGEEHVHYDRGSTVTWDALRLARREDPAIQPGTFLRRTPVCGDSTCLSPTCQPSSNSEPDPF